jgi:hypothetical protein
MNREIKFRAWNGNVLTYYPELRNWNTEYSDLEDCEIMQFTGLKDKNGKEIYEGDIWEKITYPRNMFVVKFNNGAFNISDFTSLGTVLGNIYENPELMPAEV